MDKSPAKLCSEPNKHARPAGIELSSQAATLFGYQEFTLTKDKLSVSEQDNSLHLKRDLLSRYFTATHLTDRTVLDLGANNAFFAFWALQTGAREAVALDLDKGYLNNVRSARDYIGVDQLRVVEANVTDWSEAADMVIALALVHWLYTCTTTMGSLSKVVEFLSSLTDYLLIVEWVEPQDQAIQFFNHLDWNSEYIEEPYTRANFEQALKRNFERVEIVGDISPTRKLYAAFRHRHLIDKNNPLPMLFDPGHVISSKLLATYEGVEYWSRVYSQPDDRTIVKQATLDLASREYFILNELDSPFFPKALDYEVHEGFSEVTLEFIEGRSVDEIFSQINESREEFISFSRHCLEILSLLQDKRIMHRDLYPSNIILRDGIPVLIDFGWAVSPENRYWSPRELGWYIRPPDNSFSDVFSMGKLLELVNDRHYPEFYLVTELMTASDASVRIEEPKTLINLLDLVAMNPNIIEQIVLSDYAAKIIKNQPAQTDEANLEKYLGSNLLARVRWDIFRILRFVYRRFVPKFLKGWIRKMV